MAFLHTKERSWEEKTWSLYVHMYTYHALYINLNLWLPPWGHKGGYLVGNLTCWRWKSRFTERTWVLDGIVKPLLNQPRWSLIYLWTSCDIRKYFLLLNSIESEFFLSHSFFFFDDWTNPKLYFLFMNLLNVPMYPPFTWPHSPSPHSLKSLLSSLIFLSCPPMVDYIFQR